MIGLTVHLELFHVNLFQVELLFTILKELADILTSPSSRIRRKPTCTTRIKIIFALIISGILILAELSGPLKLQTHEERILCSMCVTRN